MISTKIKFKNGSNHKFPQGFSELEKSLERLDTKQLGTVGFFFFSLSLTLIDLFFSYLENDF